MQNGIVKPFKKFNFKLPTLQKKIQISSYTYSKKIFKTLKHIFPVICYFQNFKIFIYLHYLEVILVKYLLLIYRHFWHYHAKWEKLEMSFFFRKARITLRSLMSRWHNNDVISHLRVHAYKQLSLYILLGEAPIWPSSSFKHPVYMNSTLIWRHKMTSPRLCH